MYKCIDCERTFEEPRRVLEDIGEVHGAPAYHNCNVCPCCGGDCIEVYQCACCGEWFTDSELDNRFCDGCGENTEKRFVEAAAKVAEVSFSNAEIAYLGERAEDIASRLGEELAFAAKYRKEQEAAYEHAS